MTSSTEREQRLTGPEAGESPAVDLTSVTKSFGKVIAVDDVTLSIEENQFFALLGPSGCGKTTTLRMIGGFEEPDSGDIRLYGEPVTGLKPYQRPVNTVFQSYALFPHLTIFENVAFGLRRRGIDKKQVRNQVNEMLDLVKLPGLTDRKPTQLSGGQRQRVALARALINHPRVLLLDEPLGALDLKLRKEMQIELKRIQHEVGITFVHVTHDQEEAMTMADTIAVMNEGQIVRLGSPAEIYEDPRSSFVAGFLGASNLLPVASVDGRNVVLEDGTRLHAPDGAELSPSMSLGVRPEKIRLHAPDASDLPANVIRGHVVDTSYVGISTQFLVTTPFGASITAVMQNVDPVSFRRGDEVLLGWNPDHSFVIDGS
ncbi:MAG: ABC transporter ATP-binding protein [Acidimicrobiia bacterium]|nr:ABC transporter ATP-binding protein [Acidimicrobiia bacterium]